MKQKIWIWNHYATDMYRNKGGRHYWFAENLIKQGYDVTIFCANTYHNSTDFIATRGEKYTTDVLNNIPFVFVKTTISIGNGFDRIKNMGIFYRNLFPVAKQYARNFGIPDLILASSVHPLTLIAGIKVAKKFNKPCICEVRDLWPETLIAYGAIKRGSALAKILYKGEKWIYEKADKLIFTMEGGKNYIIKKGWDKGSGGPIDMNKVHHINNGVELREFDFNRDHYTLSDIDLDNDKIFKVIYAGSIRLVNNLGLLLEVGKILKGQGESSIRLLIWGDGSELHELERKVIEYNLTNVVFKGRVEKQYIPYILSKGHLNIVPGQDSELYQYGVSSNKLFDYFASGKPCLCTYRTGYSLINKYMAGVELEESSELKIAEAIKFFAQLPPYEYQQYCSNAWTAANDYDFSHLSKKLIEVIQG